MIGSIQVHPTPDAVADCVADWLIARAIASAGPCRVALSGGSTPKLLFTLLAQPSRAARMPWQKLHLFWGDERYVPYASPDSNAGECQRLLLDHVPIPPDQVHPFPVTPDPGGAAQSYAATLQRDYGSSQINPATPLFDVVFLGLGDDGHTASLIPGQPVLLERTAWAAAVSQGRPEVRLTLTYPALESAAVVAFLVTGAAKLPIMQRLRAGQADVPAAYLHPAGETIWFLDAAAAGQ